MSLNTILATAPLTTTNYILKATGTTIGNSLIWDNGTNVGIGNTNTSYTLDVSGTLRNTTSAYFATTSGNVGIGTLSPSSWATSLVVYNNQLTITGGGYDGSFADSIFFGGNSEGTNYRNKISNSLSSNVVNQKMKFSIASGATTFVDVMTLVGNGNVGIGTSSPTGKLDVASRGITTGSMPVGSIIQTVSYTFSSGFSTSSSSDTDTGLNLSITPTSSTSKILIIITAYVRATNTAGNCYTYSKVWRGTVGSGTLLVNGYGAMGNFASTDIRGVDATSYVDSPATTSAVTYRYSLNSVYAGTVYLNSTTSPSTITLMEIAQ